jgi:foldase protein PrsA
MYLRCFGLLLLALCAFPQTSTSQPVIAPEVTPDTVIATINGQKFTARQYQQLLANIPQQMRETAMKQPRALLEQYAMFQNILAEAEKSKLDQQSPYSDQIAEARRQILVQAQINDKQSSVVVSPDEVKKFYDDNRERYAEVKAKVIFISLVSNEQTLDGTKKTSRGPEESKKLAHDVVSKLKGGGDFVQLAKEYSDDGSTAEKGADFPDAIRSTSASVPQNIREVILKANNGDILGPLEHETGFYIFRIESMALTPFEQVKGDIYNELKQAGLKKWLDETKNRSTVTIENEAFFTKTK